MRLYIKYMVSQRCKAFVELQLVEMGITHFAAELGTVDTNLPMTSGQLKELQSRLQPSGLVLLNDKKAILIERVKNVIIEMIHHSTEMPKESYSDYIAERVGHSYSHLSEIFSEVKGITIQQFIIQHKIELVKELLLYDELTLTEIAHKLHYSSVAHLSNQFKKITGHTPSFYKDLKDKRRRNLESL